MFGSVRTVDTNRKLNVPSQIAMCHQSVAKAAGRTKATCHMGVFGKNSYNVPPLPYRAADGTKTVTRRGAVSE